MAFQYTSAAEESALEGVAKSLPAYLGTCRAGMTKIDYIVTDFENHPTASYAIEDDNCGGCFYSDCFSVVSFVYFKDSEKE